MLTETNTALENIANAIESLEIGIDHMTGQTLVDALYGIELQLTRIADAMEIKK